MPTIPDATTPTGIHFDKENQTMQVTWRDGHASVYPFTLLRKECPCAVCNDLRARAARDPLRVLSGGAPTAADAIVVGAEPVGRYALKLRWRDGHDTGIYSFEFLRELCPCPQCQGKG
ncbi:MAG: DUF971 domain-containing protein [Abditibacteriales bacterium]|nr:DUF971 domain-containing protein [Abditibacteriales bacterium]MDW8366862.1 DUF971 domain-containing protein [Abditibacteriales bacterium]